MRTVRNTFQERVNEINIYYAFIEESLLRNLDDDLKKILKSNLILMLYNLVESSVSNAIEEIHINIHLNKISFDFLTKTVKKNIVNHLKSNVNAQKFVSNVNEIAIDIVKFGFQKEKISNGNIDNKTISELSNSYGFSQFTTYAQTKAGNCLEDIKGRRNDLAHGTFSFTEVGKEYTVEDLQKMKDETINYISEIISNIETYLNNQEYKISA